MIFCYIIEHTTTVRRNFVTTHNHDPHVNKKRTIFSKRRARSQRLERLGSLATPSRGEARNDLLRCMGALTALAASTSGGVERAREPPPPIPPPIPPLLLPRGGCGRSGCSVARTLASAACNLLAILSTIIRSSSDCSFCCSSCCASTNAPCACPSSLAMRSASAPG